MWRNILTSLPKFKVKVITVEAFENVHLASISSDKIPNLKCYIPGITGGCAWTLNPVSTLQLVVNFNQNPQQSQTVCTSFHPSRNTPKTAIPLDEISLYKVSVLWLGSTSCSSGRRQWCGGIFCCRTREVAWNNWAHSAVQWSPSDQLGFSKLAHCYRAVPPLKTGIKMKSWLFFQKLLSITNYGSGGSSVIRDKGLTFMKSTSHFGSLAH